MTSRAIVILTDPAQCELADADMLVQAVLQIQQLNKAGLASSQAFCDHPAAAMKFLDAYTRAYPELQERSSELPPPDVLHSVIADGRLKPLQPMPAPDGAKPDEASKNYPLYVLSLGAPEVLIRAMNHNHFGTSEIEFVEIAPPEAEPTESMSVAEAVDQEAMTRPSWHPEDSAERREDDEYFSPVESGSSDPLKLESVEIDLDHIAVERQQDPKSHQKSDQPALSMSPVSGAASDSSEGQQDLRNETNSGSFPLGNPLVETAHTGAIVSGPDAKVLSPAEAVVSPDTPAASVPSDTTALTTVAGGEALEPLSGSESEPAEAKTSSVEDVHGPGTADERGSGAVCDDAEQVYSDDATAAASASQAATDDDDDDSAAPSALPLATDRESTWEKASDLEHRTWSEVQAGNDNGSIRDQGEDVIYPPNDSFAVVDVTYPPAEFVQDGNWLEAWFGGSENSEVVDLDSLLKDFPGSTSSAGATLGDLHLELMQVRGACRVPSDEVAHSRLEPGAPTPPLDGQDTHQQSDQDLGPPVVHELDI
jgi:hypothetical protein